MRKFLFVQAVLAIASAFASIGAAQNQSADPPAQPPKPPVSLSPALPVVAAPPADPTKMAEPAGTQPAAAKVDSASFVLGVEDQISISMWDDARFNGSHTIRPDGKISLPLLGEIQAAGLTPLQLEDSINKVALTQMKTPRATVIVIGVHSKHIYFDGDGIKQPGPMDLVIPIHLLEAISARGGFTDFGNRNKITILRDNKPLMIVNGNSKSIYIRYKDLTDGKHPNSNLELKDGDHVVIK